FFLQAEDGIRDFHVTGVQTCALPIFAERGINEVMVESGATLAAAFLEAGLVDEVLLYVAPVLLGSNARPLFDGLNVEHMSEVMHMETIETRQLGDDIRVLLRPRRQAAAT